ncbi:MAG: hypothetical protein ACR2G3_11695 [Solirubrobacterales bacterium]
MRALYDSQADALSIDLIDADRWDSSEVIDPDYCTIALAAGRPANVELLAPREHLSLLERAATSHGLDSVALTAAAQSALAAPDRQVSLDVSAPA